MQRDTDKWLIKINMAIDIMIGEDVKTWICNYKLWWVSNVKEEGIKQIYKGI